MFKKRAFTSFDTNISIDYSKFKKVAHNIWSMGVDSSGEVVASRSDASDKEEQVACDDDTNENVLEMLGYLTRE